MDNSGQDSRRATETSAGIGDLATSEKTPWINGLHEKT